MNKLLLGDGGMGSELQFRGIEVPSHIDSIWSALAITNNPEVIKNIHLDYIESGSDYITINNYALTQPILARANAGHQLEDLTLRSIELAKESVKESGKSVMIAGSLPPLETSYRSDLILEPGEMKTKYEEISSLLLNRVDIIICETMASSLEARCALESIQIANEKIWVSWTLHGDRALTLPSGESLKEAFTNIKDLRSDAYLINCCGANIATQAVKELAKLTSLPVGAYANSENIRSFNRYEGSTKKAEDMQKKSKVILDQEGYAVEASKWIDLGATIIGGCCRTRPEHIKKLREIMG